MLRVDINVMPWRSILSSPLKISVDTLKLVEYSFKDFRNGKTKILSEFKL